MKLKTKRYGYDLARDASVKVQKEVKCSEISHPLHYIRHCCMDKTILLAAAEKREVSNLEIE